VYVWGSDGGLVLSTPGTRSAGKARPGLAEALRRQTTTVTLETGSGLSRPVFRVWSPVRSSSGRPLGVAEILLDQGALGFGARVWVAVGLVLVTLWLALAVLVGGATGRLRWESVELRDENEELAETTRRLEATLLETVETLNAAVEARDPYTAGHSQRVQRVALAIGRELGLPPKELSVLGTAAIFHDIGKIGIPDSILTKPDILSRSETEVMREHVTRGAEIVARIGFFAESVEAIRYHHERWDGFGYPEGRAGEDIPLQAAIVGLSDAWDAMTTDRPYATALPLSEALKQIELGRGRQFSPVVADAFLAVVRRHPAEILPPDSVVREFVTAAG